MALNIFMQKYFELPKNDPQSKANNDWFEYCRKHAIPFIILRCRTTLADVEWDYIAYSTEFDDAFKNLNGELRDKAILLFKKYADHRSEYQASDLLISFKKIEISKAKSAANELYDLIIHYSKRTEI